MGRDAVEDGRQSGVELVVGRRGVRCGVAAVTVPVGCHTRGMTKRSMMTQGPVDRGIEAARIARSLISAAMYGDGEAGVEIVRSLPPDGDEEVSQALVLSCMSGMAAALVNSLANERGVDPEEMWRQSIENSMLNGGP